jgi:prolycopene isomerase
MWQRKSTRREFIKLAAMLASSFSLGWTYTRENAKDYPVVVIGAGLGGLSSALYLSRAGFPVTVIEQHNIPGGYATAFRRGDYYFDVSLHFFGIREDIYKELGIDNKVERIPLDRTIRIISKDKDVLFAPTNSKEIIEALCKNYPKEKDGIIQYYQYCSDVFEELTKFSIKRETGSILLEDFPNQFPKMWGLRDISYAEFLDRYIKDQKTKSALSRACAIIGLPPSKASAFMAVILVGSLGRNKTYYFRSRSQDFSNALADVIKENNGNLIYGKAVDKIITKNDSVTGARSEDGKVYPAKIIVSNANAPDTFSKFLSHNKTAALYMNRLSELKPSISCFIVWLGLEGELRGKIQGHSILLDSGFDIETDFQNYLNCDAEKFPIAIAMYDNYFKGYSKPGTSTITIMALSGYEPWRRFERHYFLGNKKGYYQQKERITKTMIKRVEEKVIPGLSSMINVMESATPLTNMRYTKNPEGAIYGYPCSVDNCFTTRIQNSTPIKGLYLSSGWGKYSGSYTGGIMNGRATFRQITEDL